MWDDMWIEVPLFQRPDEIARSRSSFTRKCGSLCRASAHRRRAALVKMKMKCLFRAKETRLEASPQRRPTLESRNKEGTRQPA